MRLTRDMKDNLYTIIVNKLKSPFETKLDTLTNKFQEEIFKEYPTFKAFTDEFGMNYSFRINLSTVKLHAYFPFFFPSATEWGKIMGLDRNIEYYNYTSVESMREAKWAKFNDIKEEIADLIEEQIKYEETLQNLRLTIESCNTDKQLADMYPDFVQYFNTAGIVVKAQKHLPAKLGLPDELTKYGLVLENQSNSNKSLEDAIKEDIEEGKE